MSLLGHCLCTDWHEAFSHEEAVLLLTGICGGGGPIGPKFKYLPTATFELVYRRMISMKDTHVRPLDQMSCYYLLYQIGGASYIRELYFGMSPRVTQGKVRIVYSLYVRKPYDTILGNHDLVRGRSVFFYHWASHA